MCSIIHQNVRDFPSFKWNRLSYVINEKIPIAVAKIWFFTWSFKNMGQFLLFEILFKIIVYWHGNFRNNKKISIVNFREFSFCSRIWTELDV